MTVPTRQAAPARTVEGRLRRRLLALCRREGILPPGQRLLVAVSGGPDSLALLHLLAGLAPARGWVLAVGHVCHNLQPQARQWVDVVRAQAESLGLPFLLEELDPDPLRSAPEGVEAAARRARYEALARMADRFGAGAVAVGHTLDDQAETVLLRILRGAGLDGLAAMEVRAPWPLGSGPELIRPLLTTAREEVEAFLEEKGLTPVRDPMNRDPRYLRVRIRRQLLPLLEELVPGARRRLAALAALAADDRRILEEVTAADWDAWVEVRPGVWRLNREGYRTLPPARRRRLLRRIVREGAGFPPDRSLVESLDRLLIGPAGTGRRLEGPPGWIWQLDPQVALFTRAEDLREVLEAEDREAPALETPRTLPRPGLYVLGRGWILEVLEGGEDGDLWSAWVPRLEGWVLRTRRPGDRIPLPGGGRRRLQDLFVDARIPRRQRDRWPLLEREGRVGWVPGLARIPELTPRPGTDGYTLRLRRVDVEGQQRRRPVLSEDIAQVLIDEETLQRRIGELARQITADYQGKDLVLVGVLKGAINFIVDLMRQIDLPLEVDFMATSSYGDSTVTSGVVRILKDLDLDVRGRDLLVVEDIVDSGYTLKYLLEYLEHRGPATLRVCALLDKRSRRLVDVPIHYVGFDIPDAFVVGYGLDYAEKYRNLPFIGVLREEIYDDR